MTTWRSALKAAASALIAALTLITAGAAHAETTITLYHYQTGSNYEAFRRLLNEFEQMSPR